MSQTVGEFKDEYRRRQARAADLGDLHQGNMSELAALKPTLLERIAFEGYIAMEWWGIWAGAITQMDIIGNPHVKLMQESSIPPTTRGAS